jgi:hypothetical protein
MPLADRQNRLVHRHGQGRVALDVVNFECHGQDRHLPSWPASVTPHLSGGHPPYGFPAGGMWHNTR